MARRPLARWVQGSLAAIVIAAASQSAFGEAPSLSPEADVRAPDAGLPLALRRDLAMAARRHLGGRTSDLRTIQQRLTAELHETARSGEPDALYDYARWLVWTGYPQPAAAITVKWDAERHNEFWLEQARSALRHKVPAAAQRMLERLRGPVPRAVDEARESLLGLSLMQQDRFPEAAAALEGNRGFPRTSLVNFYNYALSLIARNKTLEGLALLDELGDIKAEASDAATNSLRDRANLALAWTWIALDQGATARYYFRRVGLHGAHSNSALLGLGWAELAPEGSEQDTHFKRRLGCADLHSAPESVRLIPFSTGSGCRMAGKPSEFSFYHSFGYQPGSAGPQRFHAALAAWEELSRRRVHDPAVQEGLVASGYAYEQLRQPFRAAQAYERAVQRLASEQRRLRQVDMALRSARSNPIAVIERLAEPGEFVALRSDHWYAQAEADLVTLDMADEWLQVESMSQGRKRRPLFVSQDDRQTVAEIRAAIYTRVRKAVLDDLGDRTDRLQQYLLRARLRLASIYGDPAATTEASE